MPGQVIQGPNGQHIMVHAVQQPNTIQIASAPSTSTVPPLQVLPVSALQAGGCNQIVIPQQAQILQTPDGQTFIYQPTPAIQVDNTIQQPAQPTCTYLKSLIC